MPDKVVAALALAPALTVADVGAGTGYFTVRLARGVPQGTVIATDIEPDMIRYLNERATREHLPNIRAVLGLGLQVDDRQLAAGAERTREPLRVRRAIRDVVPDVDDEDPIDRGSSEARIVG